jgi:hypothetical protein
MYKSIIEILFMSRISIHGSTFPHEFTNSVLIFTAPSTLVGKGFVEDYFYAEEISSFRQVSITKEFMEHIMQEMTSSTIIAKHYEFLVKPKVFGEIIAGRCLLKEVKLVGNSLLCSFGVTRIYVKIPRRAVLDSYQQLHLDIVEDTIGKLEAQV